MEEQGLPRRGQSLRAPSATPRGAMGFSLLALVRDAALGAASLVAACVVAVKREVRRRDALSAVADLCVSQDHPSVVVFGGASSKPWHFDALRSAFQRRWPRAAVTVLTPATVVDDDWRGDHRMGKNRSSRNLAWRLSNGS